jgi:hypothetical protein
VIIFILFNNSLKNKKNLEVKEAPTHVKMNMINGPRED